MGDAAPRCRGSGLPRGAPGSNPPAKPTRVTRGIVGELVTVPQIAAPGSPLFVRLDVLQERYAQLGGDPPADLLR